MENLKADVVVVGLGHGRRHHRAGRSPGAGSTCCLLDAGERLPREPENWSPGRGVHPPPATARRADGRTARGWPSPRACTTWSRQPVRSTVHPSAAVPGVGLEEVAHLDGLSPAWPFRYADLEPFYGEAERLYAVHGSTGIGPDRAVRSMPFPFAALPHEPYVAGDGGAAAVSQGWSPASTAMGVDLRPGGRSCGARPATASVRLGAKSDAEVCAWTPRWPPGRLGWPPGCG